MLDWLRKAIRPGADEGAEARAAYDAGNWQRAVTLLQPLAQERPDDARVHYRLGDALYQLERAQEALAPLERAVRLAGNVAEHHYKLGNALKDLERLDGALACYRRALELEPRHAQALSNTGTILEIRGRTDEALDYYRRAIKANGSLLPPHSNLALLLHRMNRFAEAEDAYQALLRVAPGSEEIWCNLGNVYVGLERFDDAVRCYERALEYRPESVLAFYRLGIVLSLLEKYQEAEAAAQRAVELAPEYVNGWISLGDLFQAQRRFGKALAAYQRGIDLEPQRPELLNNIGAIYRRQGELETAEHYFKRAIEASSRFTLARLNLAMTQLSLGLHAEAISGCREVLEIEPQNPDASRNLLVALLYTRFDANDLIDEHLAFGRRFGSGGRATPIFNDRTRSDKKLRIGYVSSDFRIHPVGYALAPIIRHHDRSAVEVYLYSSVQTPDATSRWFREQADMWRSIVHLSDEAAAMLIRQDRVDILVLLSGRFDENRPLLAIHRPAPIQVSMHDPATSGLTEMDYLIADRGMVPRHTVEKFTERVVCLPTFYVHPPLNAARQVSAFPAVKNGWITFGSFSNSVKINEDVVALWAQLLHRVPTARLVINYFNLFSNSRVRSRYLGLFQEHGIPEDRLSLSDQRVDDREDHLARYGRIDIALDPFPYNGTTTTFEALGMGVPVVALLGECMRARMSAAMLRKIGLSQMIARDEAEYVEIAGRLAADLDELARLRAGLRDRVARSPLCAEQVRTRQLERLYRRMWKIWTANQEHHA